MDVEQSIHKIDLNLLVALSVLLKERHISRAADKLFISQPAMSKTLNRLRQTFDDPLLYRSGKYMVMSEKAERIAMQLPDLLASIEQIIKQPQFEPAKLQRTFSLSIPPLLGYGCLVSLYESLSEIAPNVLLEEHPPLSQPERYLRNGELDFAIHPKSDISSELQATYIGSVDLTIYAGKNHPLVSQQATLKQCLEYGFVNLLVETKAQASFAYPVDVLLAKLGLKRRVVFSSGQLALLTDILRVSDNLFVGPTSLSQNVSFSGQFSAVYHFHLEQSERVKFYLLNHPRVAQSQAHIWFKELFLDCTAGFDD
ncbi:LysR family transcriptional regulator [Thalassotalea sp. HSM 43]|uniref:LysR family transcriptional regulator n=1 Tax=Thalassotalea sp. HSM 43 TaxID=2552945 RepID=UPI00107FF2A4|nr:LysR family transcriptional regulator [Thalassotalea sp. HSM 43]QBY04110.1 LysR family transcriptional regulator [Thalassotalea sp. HSM 43]